MNILPKKRWHVRTKDNVARVRRDQAAAREEEKGRVERAAEAEREFRTNLLRQRAATERDKEGPLEQSSTVDATQQPHEHVNFFADLEEQERTFGANKEYEKEKRLEKETEERKIGLLKYLGEGSSEYMKETPWYQKPPERHRVPTKMTPVSSKAAVPSTSRVRNEPNDVTGITSETRRRKRSKKSKRRRRERRSSSSKSSSSESEEDSGPNLRGNADIEKLRAERLKREREERAKTEALLRKMKGEKEADQANPSKEYEQRYSSQFNPELARQNRPK